ncbi:type II and III secretion system protein family protein [Aureimonas ureilytica]|uniref:type II and III secretion system protein family protein n=1 Tax=Aureimonas ureilytica TaxID=401562 RepID=UPI0003786976|nr:type II and III secretion system protein family protein [Aureimonas ureilytica]
MALRLRTRSTRRLAAALQASLALPALLPLPAFAESAVVAVNRPQQTISLGLDKSKVIDLPRDAHDIVVSNPAVADAVTRTARRIYIFGKQIGQTNIFVFDANGREIAVLDLKIERDISALASTIRRFIPTADVRAEMLNDNVILTGTVENAQDAQRAVDLANIFVTGGEATTGQYIKTATSGASAAGSGGVAIGGVSQAQERRQSSQIVNLLQIQGEDQVTLKVTVAEVQRSVVKQLGIDGTGVGSIDGMLFSAVSDNPFGLGKAISSSGASLFNTGDSRNGISSQLRALEQAGVMRTLAEPSLTAISGESASFKVGGEFSSPSGRTVTPPKTTYIRNAAGVIVDSETQEGTVTIDTEKIDYGIGLDFTPVVLSPGRISLKIRTAVSEPTFENAFNFQGSADTGGSLTLTGIRKRLADTTVELPSGGSLVIAGLVRDDVRQVVSGYPGLSKIPVLGTLFRSRDFQRYETELVVIVTPYLVRPVARQDLARPDDNLNFSSDGASNFLGRVNRVYGAADTRLPPGRYHGNVGYIYK